MCQSLLKGPPSALMQAANLLWNRFMIWHKVSGLISFNILKFPVLKCFWILTIKYSYEQIFMGLSHQIYSGARSLFYRTVFQFHSCKSPFHRNKHQQQTHWHDPLWCNLSNSRMLCISYPTGEEKKRTQEMISASYLISSQTSYWISFCFNTHSCRSLPLLFIIF